MHRSVAAIAIIIIALAIASCDRATEPAAPPPPSYDIVVYGGTSAGVTAAVQAARMGRSVILIEPGSHLGGLSSGGLGATDIGNKAAIGGLSRDFYTRIHAHYNPDKSPATQWTFEPHVAEKVFNDMIKEAAVPVRFAVFHVRPGWQVGLPCDAGGVFRHVLPRAVPGEAQLLAELLVNQRLLLRAEILPAEPAEICVGSTRICPRG